MAVFIGVYASAASSGAHLNPAITIAKAASGSFAWADVPMYITAQMLGAMIGATLVWLIYKQHFDATEDAAAKLAVFCTGPAIRSTTHNLLTEIIATCLFVTAVLFITHGKESLGSLDALPVALLALGLAPHWVGLQVMPLILQGIWGHALCILFCPYLTKEAATGDTARCL